MKTRRVNYISVDKKSAINCLGVEFIVGELVEHQDNSVGKATITSFVIDKRLGEVKVNTNEGYAYIDFLIKSNEPQGNSPATDGTGLHGSDQGKVQGDSEVQQRDDREGSGIGAGRIKAGNDGNISNVPKEWEPSPYYDFTEEHGEGGTLSGCVSS